MTYSAFRVLVPVLLLTAACSGGTPTSPTPGGDSGLAAPALDTPADNQQLDTLRPTLTVVNLPAGGRARVYDFQVSTDSGFATVTAAKMAVVEGANGKTTTTLDQDLSAGTQFFWRARTSRGSSSSAWSASRKFQTKAVAFNRPGELFDPLTNGETFGQRFGDTTFVPGKGIKLNDKFAYVRYTLPRPIVNGEISVEVEGLHPDGPKGKPKIFLTMDAPDQIPSNSVSRLEVQYRGAGGNPDNSVAFKAVLGDFDAVVEPDIAKRNDSVMQLDPSVTYLWQAIWTNTTFRVVVKQGGSKGTTIYDYTMSDSDGRGFASPQQYVFLGTNYEQFVADTGTFPGMILRNLWVSDKPRPESLGSSR